MNEFAKALEEHTKEDHIFQDETRMSHGEMALFKAETEGSLAALHGKLDDILDGMEEIRKEIRDVKETIEPVLEAYKGLIWGKKVIVGLAAVVLAITGIWGGIVWTVNSAIHK